MKISTSTLFTVFLSLACINAPASLKNSALPRQPFNLELELQKINPPLNVLEIQGIHSACRLAQEDAIAAYKISQSKINFWRRIKFGAAGVACGPFFFVAWFLLNSK